MNKSGLIEVLAEKVDITKKQSEHIVNIVFESMKDSLMKGDRIEIRGYGSFVVKHYEAYTGRNPKTGEKVYVPPKKLPFFKVGKELRERVDAAVKRQQEGQAESDPNKPQY